jgi:hypothetical protein
MATPITNKRQHFLHLPKKLKLEQNGAAYPRHKFTQPNGAIRVSIASVIVEIF